MALQHVEMLMTALLFTCFTSNVTCFLTSDTDDSSFHVTFEKVSTLFLPYQYNPEKYGLSKEAAEQMSYDPATKLLYSVGHTNVHVVDLSDPSYAMNVLYKISYVDVDVTDVEVCGNFVFVAFDNKTARTDGFVNVYEAYNRQSGTLNLIHSIVVGAVPDMIHPVSDCSKVFVAIEAEPFNDELGDLIDPPGGVGIITFSSTPASDYTYKMHGFEQFNSRVSELEQSGVRFVYRGNNNTFSNDVEPEYIAFNQDETKAYFCLQENNAIAVVDIQSETIEHIYGLGFKNWSATTMDPSDKDGGMHMNPWPVLGMYQPDSIKVWRNNGVDYIITANEGDTKDYNGFSEESRVGDIMLSDDFGQNTTYLQEKEHLGRLKITTVNGKNPSTGEYDHVYSYGGRGFSIWRADTMERVYDSGNDVSHRIAMLKPYLFNNNPSSPDLIPETVDKRSDDKGPESESLTLAQFGDYTLIMLGNERPGTISVYSIDNRLPTIQPRFETLLSDIPNVRETWGKVYGERRLSMLDPEDIRFIPKIDSPNGEPLLIVSGSVSGTLTVFKVKVSGYDTSYLPNDPAADTCKNCNFTGLRDPNSTSITTANIGLLLLSMVLFLVNKHL